MSTSCARLPELLPGLVADISVPYKNRPGCFIMRITTVKADFLTARKL